MSKNLYLIDAYAMIYRAYYAFFSNPRMNSKGINTSAAFGFINTINHIIAQHHPDYIVVAFDLHAPTFRHKMYEPYKANRPKQPEDITIAMPYIDRFLEAMNIKSIGIEGYEADDVIGSLAKKFSPLCDNVYMVTQDKDYAQLVGGNVYMCRTENKRYNVLGEADIKEQYGVYPSQIIDLLALWGDASDNIPGCNGIGEKRAKDLLTLYGSIDNIYSHIDDINGKIKENLINDQQMVYFSKQLVTICTDIPIDITLEETKVINPDEDKLRELFTELEIKREKKAIVTADLFSATEQQQHSFNKVYKVYKVYKAYKQLQIASFLLYPGRGNINESLEEMIEKIDNDDELKNLYYNIELPLIPILKEMEDVGMRVDVDAIKDYAKELQVERDNTQQRIYDIASEVFNLNSPKQVGDILFNKLQIDPNIKKTKSGQYPTNEETLNKYSGIEIVSLILKYRGILKLLTSYAEALPKLVDAHHRVHSTFNQTQVITGRLSSSNPNLQNIPTRDEAGRRIRACFIASEGCRLLSADYSQVELRVMAHFSGDKSLIDAFCNGEDIHASTASKIYNVAIDEVTDDMRRKAKMANFGIIYGISPFGLAQRLNISKGEAKSLIDGYFDKFPGVRDYINKCITQAKKDGYVKTLLGRRRYLDNINSNNAIVSQLDQRYAINAPIQGTAADIIKIAMINIDKQIKENNLKAKMILQVHDELIFDCPTHEIATLKTIVRKEMEGAYPLSVPLLVEIGEGDNWLEAH